MYFESLRVGTVTLRVFQAKKIPNNNCKPWYVKTTEKKKNLWNSALVSQQFHNMIGSSLKRTRNYVSPTLLFAWFWKAQ